jgi:hypothetical protein
MSLEFSWLVLERVRLGAVRGARHYARRQQSLLA